VALTSGGIAADADGVPAAAAGLTAAGGLVAAALPQPASSSAHAMARAERFM
jgi:hypothetical protein